MFFWTMRNYTLDSFAHTFTILYDQLTSGEVNLKICVYSLL